MIRPELIMPQINTVGLVAYYKLCAGLTTANIIFDYSFGGFVGTPTGAFPVYPGFFFDGADDVIQVVTGPSSVSTIAMWIKPNATTSEEVIDLNLTDFIEITTGEVTPSGFAGGVTNPFVDGVSGAVAVTTDWNLIGLTDTLAKDASTGDMLIGQTDTGANAFDGLIGEVWLFSDVKDDAYMRSLFEITRWRYNG